MTFNEEKAKLIQEILANSKYLPESGLIVWLAKSLDKLSYSDLINLNDIIMIKVRDSVK